MNRKDLEERLIKFAVLIIELSQNLKNTRAGNHLSGQIVRSGTSPALNYGEAQSAESHKDFVHKIKVVLKELRETHINLRIINYADLSQDKNLTFLAIGECDELISIYVKSVKTARKDK
ncbi:MAG: four helix bundle protein [Candidatus Cloacimonetes bacterium]|nr:four helix bundle protein [Candidatus Cloacimonadota bacterium]MBL7149864.1 four helix bundle protein [Candidatus Cloacimonadota bacterium]